MRCFYVRSEEQGPSRSLARAAPSRGDCASGSPGAVGERFVPWGARGANRLRLWRPCIRGCCRRSRSMRPTDVKRRETASAPARGLACERFGKLDVSPVTSAGINAPVSPLDGPACRDWERDDSDDRPSTSKAFCTAPNQPAALPFFCLPPRQGCRANFCQHLFTVGHKTVCRTRRSYSATKFAVRRPSPKVFCGRRGRRTKLPRASFAPGLVQNELRRTARNNP